MFIMYVRNVLSKQNDMASVARKEKRKKLTQSMRLYIAAKYKWRCAMCNNLLDAIFDLDHAIPLWDGGADTLANLQPLCRTRGCHNRKTDREHFERMARRQELMSGKSRYFDPDSIHFLDCFKFAPDQRKVLQKVIKNISGTDKLSK